ncbi:MAG TPA: hypothetical protein VHK90_05865, partial [Thermoanaerobaculia bacterium]|nr:hypothetical protein [Thermoanaerobaculia bacterium]
MAEVEKPGLWERLRESLTPRFAPDKPGAHHGHRSMVSSVFLSMLLAQAYAELFPPIRDSVRTHHGLMWSTGLLAFAFFVVSMRFFVGNQLYLLSDKTLGLRGDLWLMDFLVIVLETVLICFLAGLPTAALNRSVRIDFLLLLIVLYIVDISWVV